MSFNTLLVIVLTGLILASCSTNQTETYTCQPAPEVFVYEKEAGGANIAVELKLNSSLFSAPPSFALWAEFGDGQTQTMYATCKAASGNWGGGAQSDGLPVWDLKRTTEGITYEPDVLDAITSATPTRPTFMVHYQMPENHFGDTVSIVLEFNLSGDYNQFYTADFGENGQPSIIWRTDFVYDGNELTVVNPSRLVGRSHATGADNKVYSDLIGITTAKQLVTGLTVKKL